ncbi:hypothetical protein RF11_02825 [Thelohanellus kitauei]|uniref:Uncharacterized protein n=1 Tax=Thelohanellus kitauei TaxID=669202 RepID=A0A0C2J509_THEKT|nr:hypothetical protein RF11_02825 [Thelohanellus kitauei]
MKAHVIYKKKHVARHAFGTIQKVGKLTLKIDEPVPTIDESQQDENVLKNLSDYSSEDAEFINTLDVDFENKQIDYNGDRDYMDKAYNDESYDVKSDEANNKIYLKNNANQSYLACNLTTNTIDINNMSLLFAENKKGRG